jgi:hypothetical protein
MDAQTVTQLDRPLTADDVPWTLPAIEHLEDLDELGLTEAETQAYVHDLQRDLEAMRTTVYVALAENARLTRTLQRQSDTIRTQHDIIKRLMEPTA